MYYTSNPMSLGDVRPNPAGESAVSANFPGLQPDQCATLTIIADDSNANPVYVGPQGIDINDARTYWTKLLPGDSVALGGRSVPGSTRISTVYLKTVARQDGQFDAAHVNAWWR